MISLQCDDGYLYGKNKLWMYLIDCHLTNQDILIDFDLEGGSPETNGLYDLLDSFCQCTGYDGSRITIKTANMIESHSLYNIKRCANYWFEIPMIKQWLTKNRLDVQYAPTKHFGCFVGQSRWFRLWVAAWLDQNHRSKTVLTYHGGLQKNYRTKASDGLYDWTGLEELNQYECGIIPHAADFLSRCPVTLDDDIDLAMSIVNIRNMAGYPLNHPVSLNLSRFYNDFFVDIVMETNATGNVFFPTEKIWRAMFSRRPFIVVSNRDFLYNLRKLGFKTFFEYWDEGYDSFENQTRIQKILIQLDTIASWGPDKLSQLLHDMQNILDHNYETFMQLDFDKIQKVFDE